MATSTAARNMARYVYMVILLAAAVRAQDPSVSSTNSSLPPEVRNSIITLRLEGGPLFSNSMPYPIAPLTDEAGRGQSDTALKAIGFQGTLRKADTRNADSLNATDLAFISCDPTDSNLSASNVVARASNVRPKGIILYSTLANACILNGSFGYYTIYTMTSQRDTQDILNKIDLYPAATDILTATIGGNTTSGGTPSSSSNDGGPAPTTAVAMSILYSITGIITLLFLIIIATGAVRAHRHPERYGPRTGYAGRPRQSRAKGLARAMLETLPIVKFGDPEPVKPTDRDVELEEGTASHTEHAQTAGAATNQNTNISAERSLSPADAATTSGVGAAETESVKSSTPGAATSITEAELGCSICTEDFTTGEDVRVLPCNHKYHPACIDPWLLNVSGTCPLCRHDLRPETTAEGDELAPPLEGENGTRTSGEGNDDAAVTQHRRRTRFLDLHRLRHAPPDERIAALRQLREQSRTTGEAVEEAEEHQGRRARLTGRLRDRFRIRTRTQNASTPPDSTPAPAPAPATQPPAASS
ncbi:hypothetical protein HYFRA_00006755 [Hymenoscyphus fraxineus]|uniref:RING-type domain-containing protein n=1 Tax=Hymenoscyphus fraxineus TaxID=746836 RepID=A0A9N9KYL4_9HELO|nr:hypothetical protein HYFRA_00006755 [Hymenoscyphus fraxineus]